MDAEQHQEELALLLGGESVERERVLAHDEMRVEQRLFAGGGDVAKRLRRDRQAIANAAAVDDDVVGAPDRDGPGDERDHARATARASGARLSSQIATASA